MLKALNYRCWNFVKAGSTNRPVSQWCNPLTAPPANYTPLFKFTCNRYGWYAIWFALISPTCKKEIETSWMFVRTYRVQRTSCYETLVG